MHILVVEDERILCETIARNEASYIALTVAMTGITAMQMLWR